MATVKPERFPHPICERTYHFINKKRGDRGLSGFMRDCGLSKSRYHNLKRSIPTTDLLLDLLQRLGATQLEIIEILGLTDPQPGESDRHRKEEKYEQGEMMLKMMTILLEVRHELKTLKEANANVSATTSSTLTEMIAECIVGKTDEELKEQMEFICPRKITWEIFQAIAIGKRQPKNITEIEELKAIVDPANPGKYTLRKWFIALIELTPDFEIQKLIQLIQ